MKTSFVGRASFFSILLIPAVSLFGQGALTPPAPPAPTMKSLDQIASTGIAVNNINTPTDGSHLFAISAGGSYYLTGNVLSAGQDAILISASNVTLDLNGFAIILSLGSNKKAISITGNNVTVRNGTIRSWGSGGNGIDASGINDCRFEGLRISGSGAGLKCGANCIVRDSLFEANATAIATGAGCLISDCVVSNSTGSGIAAGAICTVSNCVAKGSGSDGISAGSNSTVQNCQGESTGGGYGIQAGTAINCVGTSFSGIGLSVATATNCSGISASGTYGLNATTATNCYGSTNSAAGSGLNALQASNCDGDNSSTVNPAVGLSAFAIASYCRGTSAATNSGIGLTAGIAIGCNGSGSGTGVSAFHRYLTGIGPDS